MIFEYKCNELPINIFSDLASEFPVYIYWSADKQVLLYSTSVIELFDDERIPKPLKVSDEGISFLLQSGVVPPPNTGYQNIYILGIGDTAKVATVNGKGWSAIASCQYISRIYIISCWYNHNKYLA